MESHEALLDRMVEVLKALADPTRLRLLGLIAENPLTGKELAERLAVGAPTVSHHVAKLHDAGLLTVTRDGQSRTYTLNERALQTLTRLIAERKTASRGVAGVSPGDDQDGRERTKVIRDFFVGERLKQIPVQRKKRVIVLQHLLTRFAPDRDYPEKEVNTILRLAHEDVATLRRELIDYGFMTREGGVYRVAESLPDRSVQVNQEITGDEHAWLRTLLTRATA